MSISKYSLGHLPAEVLLRELPRLVARDRAALADILAHIAEVDSRKLYVPAAYSSMVAYCMGEMGMSEDSALKRIRVARAAREFPAIFEAIAEGRLSLTAVVLLKPLLSQKAAGELLAAAEHKSKTEIARLVACLSQPELHEVVPEPPTTPEPTTPAAQVVPEPPMTTASNAPGIQVVPEPPMTTVPNAQATQVVPEPPIPPEPGETLVLTTPSPLGPVAPPRIALRINIDQETQELLRYAQELLSHRIPSGSPAVVLNRALRSLIRDLERKKFAATDRPRTPRQRAASRTRHIPAHVKRAVRERDGFQCTFVSAQGHRCESRTRLEFDHVHEFARGGEATVDGIRLRCRVHNQYTAEQTFGTEFMNRKREQARGAS